MDSPRGATPPEAYTFPDDGYDYSQHFAARGDGVFIRADGVVVQPEDRAPDVVVPVVDIPADVTADILAAHDGAPDAASADDVVDAVFAALQLDAAEQRAADAAFGAALDEWDGAEAGGLEFDEDEVRAALAELGGSGSGGRGSGAGGRRERRGKRRIEREDLEADPEAIARQVERQRREEEAAEAAAAARRAARAAGSPSGAAAGDGSARVQAGPSGAVPGSGERGGRRVKPKTIKAPKRR